MARFALFLMFAQALTLHAVDTTPEQIFQSIRANDLPRLASLITAADVNQADARGNTPLHYAAAFGSVDAVKQLIKAHAEVNAKNAMNATPLILGASQPEKIKLLLAAGADPNVTTNAGRTALIIASGRSG